MIEYNPGIISQLDLKSHIKRSHHGKDKNKKYYDDIFTFDIECTSAFINEHGNIIKYRRGQSDEYWNTLPAVSLCYEWTFGVNDSFYYGRELTVFYKLLKELPTDGLIIIWIHNASYEMHFLTNILKNMSVFARTPHKPMKFTGGEFPNIEFRCTYMLTRLSLADWGEQLGCKKAVGDLDYNKIRTPKTRLTDKELGYCERDCLVLYKGVKDYLKRYHTLDNIPLTQTGTVRREVKARLTCYPEYVKSMKKLVPKDAAEYKRLQDVFAGGYTHANRKFAGQTITGLIEHYDFASSYPAVMVCQKYPMTPWAYTGLHELPDESTFDDMAYIMLVEFSGIDSRLCNTYIQQSKADCDNARWDNGRLIKADRCKIWITEQDLLIIKAAYTWTDVKVLELYESFKQYLPKVFIEYILKLYGNKTSLKDVDGKVALYLQSKQYINALFGMSVSALMYSDIKFNQDAENISDIWKIDELTAEQINKKLDKLRNFSPREKRYFLNYSWGIYVTAYARRNIWKFIERYDSQVIYTDTDSNFFYGSVDVSWYDKEITAKLKKVCANLDINFELCRPKTKKGKVKQLGIFEKEDTCTEFRTLGAKRYCLRNEQTGKLELTVSGINKDAVYILKNDIENFTKDVCFDKDFPTVHKQLTTYCYNQPRLVWPDGYISEYKEGINLRPTGYTMSITPEYNALIKKFENFDLSMLTDEFITHLRGQFNL